MDTTLILIGVGCIIGAIIGGGVKLVQIELSQVTSLWRQLLLGLFGIVLVFSGLVAGGHLSLPGRATSAVTDPGEDRADGGLPGKVDIFWCVTDDGGAGNRALADRIAPALRATGNIGQVRVRPLQQATNAQADYGIARNIVRFDPGEHPAADTLARIASDASGAGFAAAAALPGHPSIGYLSIFVCAVH